MNIVDPDGELKSRHEGSCREVELNEEVVSGAIDVLLGCGDSHKIAVDVDGEQIITDIAVTN